MTAGYNQDVPPNIPSSSSPPEYIRVNIKAILHPQLRLFVKNLADASGDVADKIRAVIPSKQAFIDFFKTNACMPVTADFKINRHTLLYPVPNASIASFMINTLEPLRLTDIRSRDGQMERNVVHNVLPFSPIYVYGTIASGATVSSPLSQCTFDLNEIWWTDEPSSDCQVTNDWSSMNLSDIQCFHILRTLWGSALRIRHESEQVDDQSPCVAQIPEDHFLSFSSKLRSEFAGDAVLDVLLDYVIHTFAYASERLQLHRSPGCLFWGPPGTGKTYMAKYIAKHCGMRMLWYGSAPDLNGKYIGETEQLIRKIFDSARQTPNLPCVLIIDEIDSLAGDRDKAADHTRNWLNLLLTCVGSEDYPNVFLIACTNRKNSLDSAIIRSDRIERHIFFPKLDRAARAKLFNIYANKDHLTLSNVLLDAIVRLSADCGGAFIKEWWKLAKVHASRRLRNDQAVELTLDDFTLTLRLTNSEMSSMTPDVLDRVSEKSRAMAAELKPFTMSPADVGSMLVDTAHIKLYLQTAYGIVSSTYSGDINTSPSAIMREFAHAVDLSYALYIGSFNSTSSSQSSTISTLKDLRDEVNQYAGRGGVLVTFDLDALVGLAVQSNTADNGQRSTSHFIHKNEVYDFVKALYHDMTYKYHHDHVLAVFASSNSHLRQQFANDVRFGPSICSLPWAMTNSKIASVFSPDGRQVVSYGSVYGTCCSDVPLPHNSKGLFCWSVKIDKTSSPPTVLFGTTTMRVMSGSAEEQRANSYIFRASDGKILGPNSYEKTVCRKLDKNDIVTFALSTAEPGALWMFLNGESLGEAFTNITTSSGVYPFMSIKGDGDAVTVLQNVPFPLKYDSPLFHEITYKALGHMRMQSMTPVISCIDGRVLEHSGQTAEAKTVMSNICVPDGSYVEVTISKISDARDIWLGFVHSENAADPPEHIGNQSPKKSFGVRLNGVCYNNNWPNDGCAVSLSDKLKVPAGGVIGIYVNYIGRFLSLFVKDNAGDELTYVGILCMQPQTTWKFAVSLRTPSDRVSVNFDSKLSIDLKSRCSVDSKMYMNSNGNLRCDDGKTITHVGGGNNHQVCVTNQSFSSGTKYVEMTVNKTDGNRFIMLGLVDDACANDPPIYFGYNQPKRSMGVYLSNGCRYDHRESNNGQGPQFSQQIKVGAGAVVGMLADFDKHEIWYCVQATVNSEIVNVGCYPLAIESGSWRIGVMMYTPSDKVTVNLDATMPSCFSALH